MAAATSTSTSSSTSTMDTTRVCIKNLPPSCKESDLKSHLNSIPTPSIIITDCKILKTIDGKSRKLAFVGFKTFQMAQNVVSFFHKTYLGTSRLSVELAFSKGSSSSDNKNNNNRPWSKYSVGSSRHDSIHKVNTSSDNDDDDEKRKNNKSDRHEKTKDKIDKKKEEFLAVMMGSKKGNSTSKLWANDDGMNVKNNEGSGDNDYDDASDTSNSNSSSSSSDKDEDDIETNNRKKQGKELDSPQKEAEKESQSSSTIEFAADRLFVRNLPFYTTEEEVKELFSTFGHVIECHIPVDDSNHSKGYAFVKFAHSKEASESKQQLDGSSFQGRLIHVLSARPEREDNKDNNNTTSTDEGGSSTHKKKREIARQQGAV